jgi:hypothetical protein
MPMPMLSGTSRFAETSCPTGTSRRSSNDRDFRKLESVPTEDSVHVDLIEDATNQGRWALRTPLESSSRFSSRSRVFASTRSLAFRVVFQTAGQKIPVVLKPCC